MTELAGPGLTCLVTSSSVVPGWSGVLQLQSSSSGYGTVGTSLEGCREYWRDTAAFPGGLTNF